MHVRVLAGAGGRRDGFAARPEKPHRSAHDFIGGALLALFIVPLAGLDAAFDIDLVALLQVLLRELRLLAPQDDPVPLGALLAFPRAVFEDLIGSQGEIADRLAAGGVPRFRVATQPAHQNHFVD